ncbi:MAG: DEAD/DEAH box helicase, partial [Parabacteroides sp.]
MLRNYQLEICEKVNEAFQTHRSVMMQMPTGTGKTVVLASLVRQYLPLDVDFGQKCSVLIVAHRMELIEQIGVFLNHFGIDCGVIAGGKWPASFHRVMVASIQTLAKKQNQGLDPSLVIIDEAHHALAKSYQILWTAWPEARFLGLTATPYRLSGEGFTDLFEVLVESWSVKRFIAEGWLSPYDYYSIRPESEEQQLIDSLKKRGADGDFQQKELHEKLDLRPSIERLYDSFQRYASDKKGIVYAIDIAHAEHIADYYLQQGAGAVVVSSKTPLADRRRLIDIFKSSSSEPRSIQILVSVDLFSEGFDCPDVEFIQLARPTLSLAKYLQMVGRGLRPCQGKACCTIIDNVGAYRTFGLPSADRAWEDFFLGKSRDMDLPQHRNEQFLWLGSGSLQDETDDDIVKIVSHEGMASQFAYLHGVGFACRKKGKVTIWRDLVTGVEFDSHPQVVNYRGLELATADGETFFPRIRSKWIDAKHGINRKALETQVGEGIG